MYRNIELAIELSKIPIIKEIDSLKAQVDSLRPLPKETEQRILQKFRLDWNYHSNAIEGNPYTYGETVAFLLEGITAKGKTLKDHLDIKGHDESINYLLKVVKEKEYQLTEAEIRNLHKLLLKEPYLSDAITADGVATKKEIKLGEYKQTPNHVKTSTGAIHYYASPEETPIKMGELMNWFNKIKNNKEVHPLVIATLFHHQFVAIHPFDDGNGRMVRLLMNLILLQNRFPAIVVKQDDRMNYYQVLRQADVREYLPITEYMAELLLHSLKIYWKGAKGESIEEVNDINKEVLLLKKSIETKIQDKEAEYIQQQNLQRRFLKENILPLFKNLIEKTSALDEIFVNKNLVIYYQYSQNKTGRHTKLEEFENFLTEDQATSLVRIDFNYELKGLKLNDRNIAHSELIYIEVEVNLNKLIFKNRGTELKVEKEYNSFLSKNEINLFVSEVIRAVLNRINSTF